MASIVYCTETKLTNRKLAIKTASNNLNKDYMSFRIR